jgi:hypothetical protein
MEISCPKIYCLVLAMLIFAGILISSNHRVMAQSCQANALGLVSQCEKYVRKSGPKAKPSWGCCAVVKIVDVTCVCKLVSKEIEDAIDMEKVVYVARSCGKKIASGTKCGSKLTFSS